MVSWCEHVVIVCKCVMFQKDRTDSFEDVTKKNQKQKKTTYIMRDIIL